MNDDGKHSGRERPANDNHPPNGDARNGTDATERLDTVVLTIARLIGRRMAREDFEALQAANDNRRLAGMPEVQGNKDEDA